MIYQKILEKRVSDDRRFAARPPSVKFSINASRDGAAKSAYVFRPPAELGSLNVCVAASLPYPSRTPHSWLHVDDYSECLPIKDLDLLEATGAWPLIFSDKISDTLP